MYICLHVMYVCACVCACMCVCVCVCVRACVRACVHVSNVWYVHVSKCMHASTCMHVYIRMLGVHVPKRTAYMRVTSILFCYQFFLLPFFFQKNLSVPRTCVSRPCLLCTNAHTYTCICTHTRKHTHTNPLPPPIPHPTPLTQWALR